MTVPPSLETLNLLAITAQRGNLSAAAERLGMTQSAASRRIARFEERLGVALLQRHWRGVALTAEGEQYLAAVIPALDTIMAATDAIRNTGAREPLRLRVYSTFAARWLLPRLPDFHAKNPGIEVRIDTIVAPVSFARDNVDLAIQFGEGAWPGSRSQLLLPDLIEPVCTPDFAARHRDAIAGGTLQTVRLLDCHYRRADWPHWAEAAGCRLDGAQMMTFPSSLLAYQAAAEGLGIAMAQIDLVPAELLTGVLVRPFARPLRRPLGYFLVTPARPEPERVRIFRRWISRLAPPPASGGRTG